MKTSKKGFDCVEMQHKGGDRLTRLLVGMTNEEKVAYFARGTAELRKRQEELRRKARTS